MTNIAIDIAIQPSTVLSEQVIQWNSMLVKKGHTEIQLGCHAIPHISLAMGGIKISDLTIIENKIKKIMDVVSFNQIIATHVHTFYNSDNTPISWLGIKKNELLQTLHELIHNVMIHFWQDTISPNMFISKNTKISDSTIDWVSTYQIKASYANFNPHITIGYGDITSIDIGDRAFPLTDHAPTLGIFQLGNHCTCQKLLCLI